MKNEAKEQMLGKKTSETKDSVKDAASQKYQPKQPPVAPILADATQLGRPLTKEETDKNASDLKAFAKETAMSGIPTVLHYEEEKVPFEPQAVLEGKSTKYSKEQAQGMTQAKIDELTEQKEILEAQMQNHAPAHSYNICDGCKAASDRVVYIDRKLEQFGNLMSGKSSKEKAA